LTLSLTPPTKPGDEGIFDVTLKISLPDYPDDIVPLEIPFQIDIGLCQLVTFEVATPPETRKLSY